MEWAHNMAAVTSKAQATTTRKKIPHKLDFAKIKDTKGVTKDEMVGRYH